MSPAPDGWRDVTADMEPDMGIAMAASVGTAGPAPWWAGPGGWSWDRPRLAWIDHDRVVHGLDSDDAEEQPPEDVAAWLLDHGQGATDH